MTAIKKFMSDVWAKTKEIANTVWTKIKTVYAKVATKCASLNNKYLYLFLAFVLVLALFTAVAFIIDTNTGDISKATPSLDEYKMAWHYAPLYAFLSTYEERYLTYLDDMEQFEAGMLNKKPTAPEYKYETAMADRIIEAAQRNALGEATAMDQFWLTTGINTLNSVSALVYNQNQTSKYSDAKVSAPFSSFCQILVLLGASLAMLAIVAKSAGRYDIGLTSVFGNNTVWFYISLPALILTIPTALYSLLGKSYTWSTLLFLAFVFAQTTLAAFGQFTLRKQGFSKMKRFLLSTGGSYAFSLLFFLVGMLNGSEYGTFGAMSLFYSQLLVVTILLIAPLWVNAAYLMNGSIMATALPYACFGITFTIFPSVIITFEKHLYSLLLFFLAFIAFIAGALVLTIMLIVKNKKALPFPGDILCEMYEEGAPEITVPESYVAAVTAKKEAKATKKAAKNDFAFLDEQPAEATDTAETTDTTDTENTSV